MAWQAEVDGGGARALLAYLKQKLPKDQHSSLSDISGRALTPSDLRQCANWLRQLRSSSDPQAPSLRQLLAQQGGARAVARPTVPEQETSEKRKKYLDARRVKLLRLDEEMRYGHLVKNIHTQTSSRELQKSLTSVKQHMSIGANMVVSRIVAFIVLYIISKPLTDNQTTRTIVGLGGAIAMMVIEMVLYITRAAKYDLLEQRQRKLREGVFSTS